MFHPLFACAGQCLRQRPWAATVGVVCRDCVEMGEQCDRGVTRRSCATMTPGRNARRRAHGVVLCVCVNELTGRQGHEVWWGGVVQMKTSMCWVSMGDDATMRLADLGGSMAVRKCEVSDGVDQGPCHNPYEDTVQSDEDFGRVS